MALTDRIKRFQNSFRSKLLLIFITATLMITTIMLAAFVVNQINTYKGRLSDKATLTANLLASGIRIPLFAEDQAALQSRAAELFDTPQVARVVITGVDGKILLDVHSPGIPKGVPVVTASVPVNTSTATPSADSALAGLSSGEPSTLGKVTVDIDASGLRGAIARSVAVASVIALGFCVLVVSLCYPVLKRVTSSFQTLTTGLEGMKSGDFSLRIPVGSDDEAGRATVAVNTLAEALEERETENRMLHEDLVKSMRREMSEEKRKLMAKLIQTNRMTSLGLLVSSMAHNINTPNSGVKLAGENLARCWKDVVPILDGVAREEGDFVTGGLPFSVAREELQRAAESIVHNADRIDRVIKDLRCYSIGAGWELTPNTSVNKAVEGGLSIIRAHGKHAAIPVAQELDQNVPSVTGNLYQLEQVVVNLLQNALLAMKPDQGRVTVGTRYDSEHDEVLIIVSDEGEGISEDSLRSLNEPFISTRLDSGGSGLGLYISNFLVTEHKGRITFHTEPGRGTTATVHLSANQRHPA